MRPSLMLLCCASSLAVGAQLNDPGFEQMGAGWGHWCDWEFVGDTPPGGGMLSLRMSVVSAISPDCFLTDELQPLAYQEVPGVQSGEDLTIDLWQKAVADDPNDELWMSTVVIVGWITSPTTFAYDYLAQPSTWIPSTSAWQQAQVTINTGNIPEGSTPVLFLGGHGFNASPGHVLLDNVGISISTGVVALRPPTPLAWPNPASEMLLIGSERTPLAITAIDAGGRSHELERFNQRDHTLEVDVSSLSPGIVLLRITTLYGTSHLRFVKV